METTVLMIAMLLSFVAGAYIRAPFALWKRHTLPERAFPIHLEPIPEKEDKEDREQTEANIIMQELMNAWRYNGTPQKEVKPRD